MKILEEVNSLINEIAISPKSLIAGGLLTAGTIGGVGGIPGIPSPTQVIHAKNMAKTAYKTYIYGKPLVPVIKSKLTQSTPAYD